MINSKLFISNSNINCIYCGNSSLKKIFERWRTVQDFGAITSPTRIEVQNILWQCRTCGMRFQQYPEGILPRIRYTARVQEAIERWVLSGWTSHRIATELSYFGITIADRTVRALKQRILSRPLHTLIPNPPIPKGRKFHSPSGFILSLDETKKRGPFWRWKKGPHKKLVSRYLLVARNAWTKQVLDIEICPRDSSNNWIRLLTRIEKTFGKPDSIICDHGLKLLHAIHTKWPRIRIYFDPFHVIHIVRLKFFTRAYKRILSMKNRISQQEWRYVSSMIGVSSKAYLTKKQDHAVKRLIMHALPFVKNTYRTTKKDISSLSYSSWTNMSMRLF